MSALPNDVARCAGKLHIGPRFSIYLLPCIHCRRRTDRGEGPHVVHQRPPHFTGDECPDYIPPENTQ